jgi:hypothetical protein
LMVQGTTHITTAAYLPGGILTLTSFLARTVPEP